MVERYFPGKDKSGKIIPFPKGHKKMGGRGKGTPNKTTKILKDAILLAATDVGEDGSGKDGLVGYLRTIAMRCPQAFVGLLGRVIPVQITGEGGGPIRMITMDMSNAEAAQAYQDTLKSNG
jgi:hypothetical protein